MDHATTGQCSKWRITKRWNNSSVKNGEKNGEKIQWWRNSSVKSGEIIQWWNNSSTITRTLSIYAGTKIHIKSIKTVGNKSTVFFYI